MGEPRPPPGMAERPNLVLFVTDSQGWNVLGEVGGGFVETPTLDRMAAEGVTFDGAYCTSPVCTPSRAGLFTGRYPHTAGAWANNVPLGDTVRTMGEYLQRAGYRTAYVGKWHLDGTDYFGTGVPPEGYDPDYWYDGRQYLQDLDPAMRSWWRGGMRNDTAEHDVSEMHEMGVTREDTWAGNVTDRAREFVADAAGEDEPFFLVVSYDEPHEPSVCPPPFCDAYRDEEYPLPDNHETVEDLSDKPERHREQAAGFAAGDAFLDTLSHDEHDGVYRPLYFGSSTYVDDEIGRVLDALDAEAGETMSVFTTDHGHHLGAHGLDGKGGTMYDEVANVPLIVRAPGLLPEGERTDAVTSHLDLLPTFLDYAGATIPPALDGESARPVLEDPDAAHREAAMVEYHRFGLGGAGFTPIRCLVTDEYKLVVNLFDADEFYDREADPGEVDNRIDDPDLADARDALHDDLLVEMARTRDPLHAAEWKARPWREDAELTAAQSSSPDRRDDGFLPRPGEDLVEMEDET